jgi:hypothetical protein
LIFVENYSIFKDIRAHLDSDIFIPQLTLNATYDIKQYFKNQNEEVKVENYGSWDALTGLIVQRNETVISRRRKNLSGYTLTSSFVHLNKSSRLHLTDFVDKHIDSIFKVNYITVNTILDSLNAHKREFFQMTWGYFNIKTKKWSGMVGDIVHKGADIGG